MHVICAAALPASWLTRNHTASKFGLQLQIVVYRYMWHDDKSLRDFLSPAMPNDTCFLFMSYAGKHVRIGTCLDFMPQL